MMFGASAQAQFNWKFTSDSSQHMCQKNWFFWNSIIWNRVF